MSKKYKLTTEERDCINHDLESLRTNLEQQTVLNHFKATLTGQFYELERKIKEVDAALIELQEQAPYFAKL